MEYYDIYLIQSEEKHVCKQSCMTKRNVDIVKYSVTSVKL